MDFAQPLPKPLETGERSGSDITIESPLGIESGAQSNALAQSIDDRQLPVYVPSDHHMKTVGSEINRREQFWRCSAVTPTHCARVGTGSGRERGAATTGGGRVRITDDELRAVETFFVVDLGPGQILQTHRVDQ